MLATSQRADGTRSCGISSTHKPPPPPTPKLQTVPFIFICHPLPTPISFCSASILQIVFPPRKWIWGKFKGSIYILFPPWFQFVVIFCWMLTRGGSFWYQGELEEALNPPPFSHQSSVRGLPRRHMLTDFTVNLTQYCFFFLFFPEGCTHTHAGILKSIILYFENVFLKKKKKKATQIPHNPTL